MPIRTRVWQLAILLLLAFGALLIGGYHPYVEDAEIYVPGIKQALDPSLYPSNSAFFTSHAHWTIFPHLIAASVRFTHLPLEWALLGWQLLSIFLLLLACRQLGGLCFHDPPAQWGGAVLVACLLTIPVAGTGLYIMDQYLTPRSFSTPAAVFLVVQILEKRLLRAGLLAVFIVAIHPLMALFTISYALALELARGAPPSRNLAAVLVWPFGLFPPVSGAYRAAIDRHAYFFLLRWQWYEWLGIWGPLLLLYLFQRIARRERLVCLTRLCRSLIAFGLFYLALSLAITVPPRFANLSELQPMRSLHLLYILLFVSGGGLLVQFLLKDKPLRWLGLFLPLCAGMLYAQRQTFPLTSHMEWPLASSTNRWVEAFVWVREHTPHDAYFALDPDYMQSPGEDEHGFRAIAERSRLADRVKDSGAVTMFPALAETWFQQVGAQDGWSRFGEADWLGLRRRYGVDWVLVEGPQPGGLACPYSRRAVSVCRIP